MHKLGLCAAAAVLTTLCGCQYSPGMVDRTIAYNNSIAESTNKLLLLNIVRASQRQPTYYSRLETDTAIGQANSSLQLTIPLNTAKTITHAASITRAFALGASSAVPNFQASESNTLGLQNLDDVKFIRGMMQPTSLDTLNNFWRAGWFPDFLLTLFVNSIDIDLAHLRVIPNAVNKNCAGLPEDDPAGIYCEKWQTIKNNVPVMQCFHLSDLEKNRHLQYSDDAKYIIHINGNPAAPNAECYRDVILASLALGLHISGTDSFEVIYPTVPNIAFAKGDLLAEISKSGLVVEPVDPANSAICKKKHSAGIDFSKNGVRYLGEAWAEAHPPKKRLSDQPNMYFARSPNQLDAISSETTGAIAVGENESRKNETSCKAVATRPKTQSDDRVSRMTFSFNPRSVEAMVYYLGEIVRLENSAARPGRVPQILRPDGKGFYDEDLFRVVTNTSENSFVSVELDGKVYSIPAISEICNSSADSCVSHPDHESTEVLTLLNQVWGLNKEQQEPTTAPVVTLLNQ